MSKTSRGGQHGFTLIEMLVTLAIFVAVLSVLVESLYSGIKVWRSVRLHQSREAGIVLFERRIAEDLRQLLISEQSAAIEEVALDKGGEKLVFRSSCSRDRQRAGRGYAWIKLEYAVVTDTDDTSVIRRTSSPYAGASAMGQKPVEETLLKNIKEVHFDYVGADGIAATWTSNEEAPSAVIVKVQPEKGSQFVVPVWLAAGIINRSGLQP